VMVMSNKHDLILTKFEFVALVPGLEQ